MDDFDNLLSVFRKLGVNYDLSNYGNGYCISIVKEYSGIQYITDFVFNEEYRFVEVECNHE